MYADPHPASNAERALPQRYPGCRRRRRRGHLKQCTKQECYYVYLEIWLDRQPKPDGKESGCGKFGTGEIQRTEFVVYHNLIDMRLSLRVSNGSPSALERITNKALRS